MKIAVVAANGTAGQLITKEADGPCTGECLLAGDELTTNEAGVSSISYADYAVAMLDEAERTGSDAHVRERISVLGK